MDTSVTALIGSLGFPIVCCLVLIYVIKDMNTQHKQEADKWVESLNMNNSLIQKLTDLLDHNKEMLNTNNSLLAQLLNSNGKKSES